MAGYSVTVMRITLRRRYRRQSRIVDRLKKLVSPRARPRNKERTGKRTLVNFLRHMSRPCHCEGDDLSPEASSSRSWRFLCRSLSFAPRNHKTFILEKSNVEV